MLLKAMYFLIFISSLCFNGGKKFVSKKFDSGQIKSEGWIENSIKSGYWYFYHENGNIESKGHYVNNQQSGYWFFYNADGELLKEGHFKKNIATDWWIYNSKKNKTKEKCIFEADGFTRLCLVYRNGILVKASRYKEDIFIKQWTSINSFKSDNPNFSF